MPVGTWRPRGAGGALTLPPLPVFGGLENWNVTAKPLYLGDGHRRPGGSAAGPGHLNPADSTSRMR